MRELCPLFEPAAALGDNNKRKASEFGLLYLSLAHWLSQPIGSAISKTSGFSTAIVRARVRSQQDSGFFGISSGPTRHHTGFYEYSIMSSSTMNLHNNYFNEILGIS